MTGFEPTTFREKALCLNHWANDEKTNYKSACFLKDFILSYDTLDESTILSFAHIQNRKHHFE